MAERFKGKIVIVTGSASGIGEATARRFVAEGAKVALVDRNKDSLERSPRVCPPTGNGPSRRRLGLERPRWNGRGGRGPVRPAGRHREQRRRPRSRRPDFHHGREMADGDVNRRRRRILWLSRGTAHLEKTTGSIVNTASVSGTGGDRGMSPYNAAKGAVVNPDARPRPRHGQEGRPRERGLSKPHTHGHDRRHDG